MKYNIHSTAEVNAVGLYNNWLMMCRNGDRPGAFCQAAVAVKDLPALLIYDLIDARIPVDFTDDKVTFTWDAPLAPTAEYAIHDWKPFCFTTTDPKLNWLEAVMNDLRIPHRRMPQAMRATPRLEVPGSQYNEAAKIWLYSIGGRTVRNIPSDDPVFHPGGNAWTLDNVDEAPSHAV
jgi:hypothetical protein